MIMKGNRRRQALRSYQRIHRDPRLLASSVDYHGLMARLCNGLTLDVACGNGPVQRVNPDIVGVDFSTCGLKEAKRGGARYLVAGDAYHLPFRTGVFDSLVCLGSLEHFSDQTKTLREMKRVLKPSGYLILSVDLRRTIWLLWLLKILVRIRRFVFRLAGKHVAERWQQPVNKDLTLKELKVLMREAGLNPFVYGHIGVINKTVRFFGFTFSKQLPYEVFVIGRHA